MSEVVKNELDTIKGFEDSTEKRRSTLTLNELNYISDKGLHKKDDGGSSVEWDMLGYYTENDEAVLLEGDYSKLRTKLENAYSTGIIDEPIYLCLLYKELEVPMYMSVHIGLGPYALGEGYIQFEVGNTASVLRFNSDNSITLIDK